MESWNIQSIDDADSVSEELDEPQDAVNDVSEAYVLPRPRPVPSKLSSLATAASEQAMENESAESYVK